MGIRRIVFGSLNAIMLLGITGTAAEEREEFNATVSAACFNKYVWRGQNINDGSVLQTNVSGSAYGFTGSIWANIDLTDSSQTAPDNAGEFSEIDYALEYSASVPRLGALKFSLGLAHYLFPNTSYQSTTEIYAGLSLAAPLSPKITWYRDVNAIDGSYIQLSAGHTFEKIAKWGNDCFMGLDLGGSLAWAGRGYNRGYFGIDGAKFNDLTISMTLPIGVKSFCIAPSLNVSAMLSQEVGNAVYERNNVWFGVELSKSF